MPSACRERGHCRVGRYPQALGAVRAASRRLQRCAVRAGGVGHLGKPGLNHSALPWARRYHQHSALGLHAKTHTHQSVAGNAQSGGVKTTTVIALVAALFGFGGIAAGAMGVGKVLFIVFALLAVASFAVGLLRKN